MDREKTQVTNQWKRGRQLYYAYIRGTKYNGIYKTVREQKKSQADNGSRYIKGDNVCGLF